MKTQKEHLDIEEDAIKHLNFIIKSSLEFDEGNRESMFHVTTSLRAFFKDNRRSGTKSILKHFQMLDKDFIDIAGIGKPVSLAPMFGGSLSVPDYRPNLTLENRTWLAFSDWYENLVLYSPNSYEFSRKDLIIELGESYVQHVDKNVLKDFHWLYKNVDNFVGWKSYSGGIRINQPNIIYSVLRMICHELIVSFHKHKEELINYELNYFDKLKSINPYSPFGNYRVALIEQSEVSIEFFCTKNGKQFKLPITGEYSLAQHKKKVQDVRKYFIDLTEEIIHDEVYNTLKENIQLSERSYSINKKIDIEPETFAAVHNATQKYQESDKILIKFMFKVKFDQK